MELSQGVLHFFQIQGFVIVSTVDKEKRPYNSCKGIVEIKSSGQIFLLDLYQGRTYSNLKTNPNISITAVDEHRFSGFCLKGKAKVSPLHNLSDEFLKAWDDRITSRLTQRLLKNLSGQKGHQSHPEVLLPSPKYLIEMEVDEVIDLTPKHLKSEG